jgi:hypothetical protein
MKLLLAKLLSPASSPAEFYSHYRSCLIWWRLSFPPTGNNNTFICFAVWVFWEFYPKTVSGLLNCYIMAIPFFRNAVVGDLFYIGFIFTAYEMSKVLSKKAIVLFD